jgi:6-phosphogluconate dehydrogenase
MVHNGIEYADMQVIGEAHELLRSVAGLEPAEQADVFEQWNRTELASYLIEITAHVLRQVDTRTDQPLIDVIVDAAGQKGTGRWTVQEALELGSPVTAIAESVFARALSSAEPEMRLEAQRVLPAGIGGTTEDVVHDPGFVEDVRKALYASKLVSYAQGLDMLTMAGREYGWDLDLATIAGLWREGCIIRAELLEVIMEAYKGDKQPLNLLFAPEFVAAVEEALPSWRRVVARAVERGIPAPVFATTLNYYDSLRRPRLNAALTQGLRDFFGAHTYRRVDDAEGVYHTLWSGDRSEVVS